jgi:hypothetical protein
MKTDRESFCFSLDKYSIQSIEDSDLSKVTLEVCHDKFNKNGSFLQLQNMIKAQHTIYGKPLLYSMDEDFEDFEEHEETYKLKACGYISEYGSNLKYEEKNDKIYFKVDAVIWNVYVPEVIAIFERENGIKKLSMEIKPTKTRRRSDGYIDILEYRYLGVVLLGEKYQTGMYDTNAQMQFSDDELNNKINESESVLRYKQEKLQKEENSMFDREAHAEKFGMTVDYMKDMMRRKAYAEGDYYVDTFCGEYVYVYSYEDGMSYGVPYQMSGEELSLDFACKKKMRLEYVEVKDGNSYVAFAKDVLEQKTQELNEKLQEYSEKIKELEISLEKQKEEFANKGKELEELKASEIKEKDEAIFSLDEKVKLLESDLEVKKAENEDLSVFKATKLEEEKKDKVKALFSKLGDKLSKTEVEEWNEKSDSMDFEDFEKDISKFALDKILKDVNSDKTTFSLRMGIDEGEEIEEKKPKSVWERLKK